MRAVPSDAEAAGAGKEGNMADLIIGVLLAAAIGAAAWKSWKGMRSGGCAGCAGACSAAQKKACGSRSPH